MREVLQYVKLDPTVSWASSVCAKLLKVQDYVEVDFSAIAFGLLDRHAWL